MGRSFKKFVSWLLWTLATSQKILFVVSFIFGVLFAVLVHFYQLSVELRQQLIPHGSTYDYAYESWLHGQGVRSVGTDPDKGRYKNRHFNQTFTEDSLDPATEAFYLYEKIPVFCVVIDPATADSALAVKNTWGKHCNRQFFFHRKENDSIVPVIKVPSKSAFAVLCDSLRQIVSEDSNFEWILFASDDTFVLPENLRYYVAPFDSSQPFYLGHAMKFWNVIYNWGDAGYVLSKGAVDKLLEHFNSTQKCSEGGKYWKNADWYLAKNLATLGIVPRDTRDYMGRGRFNGYSFKRLLFPGGVSLFERYWRDSLYLSEDGPKCCSNNAITFHGIQSKSKMYQLEYLFYHLRPFPFGGKEGNVVPPPEKTDPFLTLSEKMKNEEMDKWMNSQMTTPKNLKQLIARLFGDENDGVHDLNDGVPF